MPPLTDPSILAQFQAVLANWNYTNYVTAKPLANAWINENLGGMTIKDVAKAMDDYCRNGGTIDQIREQRLEYSIWPFHYDFRLPIGGKTVYIETILVDDDPNDPTIQIVSIHDA